RAGRAAEDHIARTAQDRRVTRPAGDGLPAGRSIDPVPTIAAHNGVAFRPADCGCAQAGAADNDVAGAADQQVAPRSAEDELLPSRAVDPGNPRSARDRIGRGAYYDLCARSRRDR